VAPSEHVTVELDARTNRGGAALGPNISAIYFTLAGAIAAIVVAMWLLRWFVFPPVPAARYTLLGACVIIPTLIVALLPRHVPAWGVVCTFAAYITAVTFGIHFGGGADNVSGPLLYALVIGLAGLLVSARAAYAAAAGSLTLYGLLIWAERNGVLMHYLPYTKTGEDAVATVIAVGVYLFLVAWVVSHTVREIHSRHRRLDALRTEAVAALSHDLKNPLGVIQSAAELAEGATPDEAAEELARIRRGVRQSLDLVNNVLDAEALDVHALTPALERLELNRLVTDVVELYTSAAATKGISLSTRLGMDLPTVQADARLLSRAFGNLLSNAVKFTDAGGEVEISTSRDEGHVVVAVHDSGRGIPPEEQGRLFEKYGRARAAAHREGAGLGLYIVRSIVEAHGGRVRVQSEPSTGTVFIVELPFA
jgi:signal transduction histidine kinase